jgi:hypothetical protein
MTTKNLGTGVSGWLDPEGRNFETTVYQASKPVLDKELNLIQDVGQDQGRRIQKRSFPSGWLMADFLTTSDMTAAIYTASTTADELEIPQDLYAAVNGWLIRLGYTNAGVLTKNILDLGASPSGIGAKRTDMVVLEVWRKLLSASPDVDGKSGAGKIWWFGNVKITDESLNFTDDILDGSLGSESTKRVQIQYRLRVIQGIDLAGYPFGMDDPTVVAYSSPTNAATPDGVATTFVYASQSSSGDPGLWRAGDGNPANTLDTVDGYMYAVPLMAVIRRNDAAFDRNSNHNGGVTSPGPSDRPDGLFYDIIDSRDIIDLRFGTSPEGWNYQEVLERNLQFLFDNELRTEIERTLIGGGMDGSTVLWADELGYLPGDGTTTGDTPGAQYIRSLDNVCRRFSDRAIRETVWVRLDAPGGTWNDNDVVSIGGSFFVGLDDASGTAWTANAPANVSIVDILALHWNDWSGTPSFRQTTQELYRLKVQNLGAVPPASVTIDVGTLPAGVAGTSWALFVQVEVEYPPGSGLTRTPTTDYEGVGDFGTNGRDGFFFNDTPSAGFPDYFDSAIRTDYMDINEKARRELHAEYKTTSHQFVMLAGANAVANQEILIPERVAEIVVNTDITINSVGYTGAFTVSDDGYTVTLDPGSMSLDDDVRVGFKGLRPFPNTNRAQFTVYYEARAPQTIEDNHLGTNLSVIPRYISPHVYVLTTGSGAQIEAYPYPYAYTAGAIYPGSGGSFSGDHELDGSSETYVSNFSTNTGMIRLETMIPMVPAPDQFDFIRVLGDIDYEGRTYFKSIPANQYVPNSFAQPLSDPKKHKVIQPLLVELVADAGYGMQGQLMLMLITRWATFDEENSVKFLSNLADNTTTACLYRVKGNLLNNRRS